MPRLFYYINKNPNLKFNLLNEKSRFRKKKIYSGIRAEDQSDDEAERSTGSAALLLRELKGKFQD